MMVKNYFFAFITMLLFSYAAYGQQDIDTSFSTPHATIFNHLYFLQNGTYQAEQAAKSFSLKIEQKEAVNYAIKLKQILDGKGLFVQMNKVPEEPNYKDSTVNKKQYYLFPETLPEVFVEFKNNRWQYGEETVKAIPDLHKKTYPFGTDHLLNVVAGKYDKLFLGLSPWQYLGILSLIVISFLLFYILRFLLKPILRKIGKMSFHIDLEDKKLLNRTTRIISLLIVFTLIKFIFPVLQLPVKWTHFTKKTLEIILTVFIAVLLLRVLEYIINYLRTLADRTDSKMDDQLIPIIKQLIKLVIIFGATFQVLHLLNVNIAALIAGLSIGGLALALAAKDTVNNLIGSLMIFLDRPFQIGDFIQVGGEMGTVVEVGFRTTRIQTKDTSVLSIPNGTIANSTLTNKGIRVFRLFEMTLGVTYDTPADLIEVFIEGIKKISVDHAKVNNDEQYINMSGFGNSSINIFYRVYLDTQSYGEELVLKEELSMRILRLATALGVRFAFPSTTVYVEDFPGQKTLVPDYPDRAIFEKKLTEFFGDS